LTTNKPPKAKHICTRLIPPSITACQYKPSYKATNTTDITHTTNLTTRRQNGNLGRVQHLHASHQP
jgi:hypothetical protein